MKFSGDGSAQQYLLAQGNSHDEVGRTANSTCHGDMISGPFASSCRENSLLLLEESVLSAVLSFCFVILAILRLYALSGCSKTAEPSPRDSVLRRSKLLTILALTAINVAILAVVAQQDSGTSNTRNTAAALSVLSSIFVGLVSYLEHKRVPRTSLLLNGYLLASLVLAIVRTRTAWLVVGQGQPYTSFVTTGTALTAVIAILEAVPKTGWPKKDISPEEKSGLYSLAFFTWLIPLIRLGSRKILDPEDLYQLDSRISAETISRQFQKTWHEQDGRQRRSLVYVLFKSFIWSLVLQPIPIRLAMLAFAVSQPFFMRRLINYLEAGSIHGQTTTASSLLFASILTYGGLALSFSSFAYLNARFLAKIRVALVSAIFQKTIELNTTHLDTSVLTLMSTDVERIQTGLQLIHDLWALPIQITISSWLLYQQLGPAFVAPLLVVLLCALGSLGVSSFVRSGILRWTKRTEERVKLVNAVVSGMKSIKISGLASPIAALVEKFREIELRAGLSFRVAALVAIGNAFFPTYMCGPITFFAAGQSLGTAEVFASLAYLQLITGPLNQLFQKIPMMLAAFACLKRIEDFLEKESRFDYRDFAEKTMAEEEEITAESVAISLSHFNAGWLENKCQLSDLNVAIPKANITIITGPVASGKSTLCKALLGEILFTEGRLRFHQPRPRIGYCDQTPFLINGSVRSNIVGFEPFDGPLYDEVLEAVLLKPDLRALPRADATEVGSGGVILSGGQKQRVALARALYLRADVYVLDDFTAGLDKPTADEIVRRLFRPDGGGLLARRSATVVWCTHNVQYLSLAHHIVALGPDGRVLHQGGPDEVLKDRQVALALQTDGDGGPGTAEEKEEDYGLEDAAKTKSAAERDASRALNGAEVYIHYFSSINSLLLLASLVTGVLFAFAANFGLVWLKFWADNSLKVPGSETHINAFYLGIYTAIQFLALAFLLFFLGLVMMGVSKVSGSVLHLRAVRALTGAPLHYLTKTDQGVIVNYFSQDMNLVDLVLPNVMSNALCIGLLALGGTVLLLVGTPALAWAYPPLTLALYALTRYYLRTSRQLRLMELEAKSPLYAHFSDAVRGLQTIRALGWSGAYSARHRRLLDDSQRPLYLLEATGLWLGLAVRLITASLAVGVTVLATTTTTNTTRRGGGGDGQGGARAGFVGAGFVALMDFSGLLSTFVQCWVQFEMSLGAVKRLKEFGETAGGEDRAGEDLRPGKSWPERGEIVIEGVDASYAEARYRDNDNDVDEEVEGREGVTLALRGLSMRVSAGDKMAVVGRTGSGKSSLLLLLLRLLDPTIGTVADGSSSILTIDGLPLRRIHRATLRQRVVALPQDAVFLAAGETFREALDPWAADDDDNADEEEEQECHGALRRVGLLGAVEAAGGLDAEVGRDALSQGQRQLFGLAAAVLRARRRERRGARGGVLLLDEVTSNVDRDTEATIMRVIGEVFRTYTVVAVTHSLESVVGFDKVFVMADGRIVKEGTPQSLIREEEGTKGRDRSRSVCVA